MKKTFLFGFLAAVCFSACKKGQDGIDSNNSKEEGLVTVVGLPAGTPVSKFIGSSGGSISSIDGRLTIEVPAGAFTTDQQITVQPISNNGPHGVNNAYRITPHNVQFTKPVKITFSYSENDVSNSAPGFLGISYQDEQGIWQAKRATTVDTTTKTISTLTRHFSDWNVFRGLEMTPEDTVIETGKFVKLNVYVAGEDLFVPIPLEGEDLVMPLPAPKEIPEKYVKTWIKSGDGTLSPHGNSAIYSAPNMEPTRNPVSVSAELNIPGKGKLYLVSNITIVSNEAVIVKAAAGPGSGSYVLTKAPQAIYDAAKNVTHISVHDAEGDAQNSKRIELIFKGNVADTLGWNYNNDVELTYTVKVNGVNTVYKSVWSNINGWHDSPGGVYLAAFGNKGEYIIGTFSAGKAGYQNGLETFTSVSGMFKIKRL
ncbi:hypothetical protein A4H97_24905 [Niastella yeongjuensis]|uniref:ZU5 domain-containing protein n=1 Tax=Niastella yeongjuensis TaxID=354355 RepID=A0A1V9F2P7_9BACT|nr:hypothetical protein [Niastella yeongjuensis]OQP52566.1 hypothetical protein A4H97_24905 [Niastella yeongjuensis]SEP34312.1 hypothetical protein SAMN05660816_05371 [Niastella yeongjuensis]